MKIKYIFTATGKYSIFINSLIESGNINFFPDDNVEFVVFTDSEIDKKLKNVKLIKIEKMGWPFDTLKRFHLINSIADELNSDYLFYGNANLLFNSKISHEILPSDEEKFVGAIHPIFYDKDKSTYPYERNTNSEAFVNYGNEGEHYYQGCFFGGKNKDFLNMSKILQNSIDKDLEKNIIAEWWDESHINKFFISNPPKAIDSGHIYPENMNIPFQKKIIQLDKNNHGGHCFLRS